LLVVLTAIHLDDETPFEADEIDDERPDRMLSPELPWHRATRSQQVPQATFGIG
jgi:hypothetical protein